jgi:hypothetical protein
VKFNSSGDFGSSIDFSLGLGMRRWFQQTEGLLCQVELSEYVICLLYPVEYLCGWCCDPLNGCTDASYASISNEKTQVPPPFVIKYTDRVCRILKRICLGNTFVPQRDVLPARSTRREIGSFLLACRELRDRKGIVSTFLYFFNSLTHFSCRDPFFATSQ